MIVSIIIPVYNVVAYIERCIRSVMNQTYSDIECIIVDDASPDDSIAIAERLIAEYIGPVRFQILHHEQNRGLSAARNTGIDAATGDYLYFLDSDDEITPDCIEKLASYVLDDKSLEMVMGNHQVISMDETKKPKCRLLLAQPMEFHSNKAIRDYYYGRRPMYIFAWNKLISKDFIVKHQIGFKEGLLWEDVLWIFIVMKYLSHLLIIPDITYKYYRRPNSITSKVSKKEKSHSFGLILSEIVGDLTPGDSAREARHYIKGFCLFYLEEPTYPVFRQVASRYLEILRDNHCFKEWLMLKTTICFSGFDLGRTILQYVGKRLKRVIR
ncbi:MAG: glycosyltransferase [Bacteroidaceae bacterium]|nr:glycosyltransferase [Bacteroidaceae bacterium]